MSKEPDFETVPSWGSVIVTGFISVVAGRIAILTAWAAINSGSVAVRWLATTGTICLGLAAVVAAGYAIGAGSTILTHFDAHRQIRTAEANKHTEEAKQMKLRTWEIEDDLGIDLDGDGIVGEPQNRASRLLERLLGPREPQRPRPRTNRYRPTQAEEEKQRLFEVSADRRYALNLVQAFIERSWRLTVEKNDVPTENATGLARSHWVGESAGPYKMRRSRYDAILWVLRFLRIIADRGSGTEGRYLVASVNEAMDIAWQRWPSVNIPDVLLKKEENQDQEPAGQPAR